jgi:hypothetical protein
VEKFFGSTRILAATIDIRCADAKQVDHLGDLLIGQAQTEKRTAEAPKNHIEEMQQMFAEAGIADPMPNKWPSLDDEGE